MTMKFGVTNLFQCSYLPEKQERLMVFVGQEESELSSQYEIMLANGFRRSGEQVYRPHCPNCNACQSLRIPVTQFQPSKSQKRIKNRNATITTRVTRESSELYYPLYENYINTKHRDGSMFPASKEQYDGFLFCNWMDSLFIEFYDGEELIAVAVTDELDRSLSALYTFYDPDYEKQSLGTFAILEQIERAKERDKAYLYLGYQIDACSKMNYKNKFLPNEQFIDGQWRVFSK